MIYITKREEKNRTSSLANAVDKQRERALKQRNEERERERKKETALLFLFEQIETCINMKLIFFPQN